MHALIAMVGPLIAQTAAAPAFAPPLGRPITYRVSETRVEGAETRRFVVERRVTFRADGDTLVAEVETLSVGGDAGRAGKLFEALARSMIGKRVVVTLDRTGKVIDVVDLDAIWAAQLAGVNDALVSKDPSRAKGVSALLAPLQSLPRAAKVARIGEMAALLVAEKPLAPIASRSITLPVRGQDGTAARLAGTEQVVPAPDGMLLMERHATGVVSGAMMTVSHNSRVDTRTGMVAETANVTTIEVGGTRLIVTRSTNVTP